MLCWLTLMRQNHRNPSHSGFVNRPAQTATIRKTHRGASYNTHKGRLLGKENVKALGARFDNDIKKWVVPIGHNLAPFQKWL
jgi:hypothetical protein